MDQVNDASQIRKAFRMARLMKWVFPLLPALILLGFGVFALLTRSVSVILFGCIVALFGSIALYFIGIQFCCCPKCGQYWWSPISLGMGWVSMMMDAELEADEMESYMCRGCGLEIGPYLRNSDD